MTNSDGCRRPENTSNRPPSEMAKPRTNIAHHVLTACSTRQAGSNSVNVQDVCCLCVTARTVIRIGCVTIAQQGESVCWLCDCHTTLTVTTDNNACQSHCMDKMCVAATQPTVTHCHGKKMTVGCVRATHCTTKRVVCMIVTLHRQNVSVSVRDGHTSVDKIFVATVERGCGRPTVKAPDHLLKV